MAIELGGVELTPKVLALGGAGVAGVFLLLSRGKGASSAEPGAVTLSPGNGLNWSDVITGPDDRGALIGASGRDGEAGPPGIPGLPGTTPTPNPPPGDTGVDQDPDGGGGGRRRRRRDRDNGGRGNGGNRQDETSGGGGGRGNRRDRNRDDERGTRGPDNPSQPNRSDPPRVDDPRLDDPKRERRRREGRGGLREDERGDQGDNFNVDVSGGRERSRGRRANARADGGRANVGNVGPNTSGNINASGGKAKADASGGNGNQTGKSAKQAAKKVMQKARGGRRGGEAFAGDEPNYQNGHGRQDGRSGAASLEVNTNPTPGGTIGGFFGRPSPLRGPHDVIVVKEGDTLTGLAQRHLGSTGAVERIYQLNRDLFVGNGRVLRAGMRLKV